MNRDREAFRKRFLDYKNGKSVRDIYGLPGYEDGKQGDYEFDGYNYTYQNKTSNGHNLSIKDGRLYSGNKIVGAGYTWYDGNNGNTYRTIGGGKFKVISTQEGPIKNNSILSGDNAHYIYKANPDEVNYLKNDIDPDDLTGSDKLFLYRSNFVDDRLAKEEKYAIPQHLPGVKRRTLSSGPYKGIKIYDNTLDSIRVNSIRNNISFAEMLGLSAETSIGRDKHMHVNETKHDYNIAKKFPYYNASLNNRHALFPTDMMNNHNYYVGNNATGIINTLIKNGTINGVLSWKKGNPFPYLNGDITEDQNNILNMEASRILKTKESSSDNPWTNAVEFYKNYNYGMGPSYPIIVQDRGNSILKTPEVQSYLKHRE